MSTRQFALVLIGVSLLVLAQVTAVDSILPVGALVTLLGNDYLLVAGIAGAALLLAVPVLSSGRGRHLNQASMPEPERPPDVPAAGDAFDDALRNRWLFVPVVGRNARRLVRNRLRTAAVETLMRVENCSRDEAAQRVAAGTWTDDSVVTAFLREDARPSLSEHVAALLSGTTWTRQCAHRTAAAILARAEHDQGRDR